MNELTQRIEKAREKARDRAVGGPDAFTWLDRLIALERAEAVWIQHQPDCSFTFDNCARVADVVNAIAAIMDEHHDQ